jgi:hypothetical protein
LAAERSAALEEAAARLAWSSEAAALGAAKLRAFFLAPLAVELVALRPFGGGPPATTLRQATLLPEVQVRGCWGGWVEGRRLQDAPSRPCFTCTCCGV